MKVLAQANDWPNALALVLAIAAVGIIAIVGLVVFAILRLRPPQHSIDKQPKARGPREIMDERPEWKADRFALREEERQRLEDVRRERDEQEDQREDDPRPRIHRPEDSA